MHVPLRTPPPPLQQPGLPRAGTAGCLLPWPRDCSVLILLYGALIAVREYLSSPELLHQLPTGTVALLPRPWSTRDVTNVVVNVFGVTDKIWQVGMATWWQVGMAAWWQVGVATWRHGGKLAWRHGGNLASWHGDKRCRQCVWRDNIMFYL